LTGDYGLTISGPTTLVGDYNGNDIVDAADYTVYRNTLGQTGLVPFSGADGNGDGMITRDDYGVWKEHYGESLPASGSATALGAGQTALSQNSPNDWPQAAIKLRPAEPDLGAARTQQPVPGLLAAIDDWMESPTARGTRRVIRDAALPRGEGQSDAREAALLAWIASREVIDPPAENPVVSGALGCDPAGETTEEETDAFDAAFDLLAAAFSQ
jgi:hypothetical protein